MRQQGTLGLHMDSEVPARGEHVTNCSRARGVPLMKWLLLATLLAPGTWSLLNEEEEELLVELHNYYRGQVFPSASAMLPLKWDPTLKLLAEGYAAKCIWNHNPDLEDTGENLYAGTGPVDLRAALEKWFLEHLSYDFQNNSCDDDKMCGHYTQMVWSDTHRVGCAVHLCNNMEGLEWEKISFLVCNYYPAGNYEDERPYVEGDSCSQCPEKLQTCENNLCVPDMDDKDGEEEDEEEEKKQKEEGMLLPAATTDLLHQADVTTRISRTSKTTSLLPTHTLLSPLVTSKSNFLSGEENKEGVPVLLVITTELYHQVDVTGSTSRSIPSTQTPTTVQRKAAIRKEVDSKARQQETRMECEPVFTISQKDIPPMTSATSSPSPPPFILLFLSFILIIIMLPLCGRG
ncbi:peptidase inhibitor 16-like isoform X1 [Syngnathoides biaculeatus]|uniref:peptidase inhibitor 16-like isoform X1 n=1 Tax=Syngnathoides biaculeatus TaxID=300417 RepID=UPI002ADDC130|nr:peptidase inhibitor 16-like isoform X1 [Syngnathoides biaculeatus]